MQSRLATSIVSQRRRITRKLSTLASAVVEGVDKALRYQMLANCSERELLPLRVTHQDLPRFVMFDGYERAEIARTEMERSLGRMMPFSAFGLALSVALAPFLRPEDVAVMAQFLG
jgi:hypothetical protein